jgi:hypothetical protein
VQSLVAEHFIAVKLMLNNPADQPHFRAQRVIWTPTIGILDHRGVGQYQSPGYLPPALFLPMLKIGLARAQIAWARYDEAAAQLAAVADNSASALAPEALYWLGIAWYLQSRRRTPMLRAWDRLLHEHPASIWAARVPPNQQDEPEP